MVRTYQEIFDDLYILPVGGAGNVILLALPRQENLSREALAKRAAKVSTAKRFRFGLGEQVRTGFLHATEKLLDGQVLRDANLPGARRP
jgi:hypothetical protein